MEGYCPLHAELLPCPECRSDQPLPPNPPPQAPYYVGGPEGLSGGESHPLDRYLMSVDQVAAAAEADNRLWPIPSLIGPGLTLLAAPPKSGKTNLALQLAWSVASGDDALGGVMTHQGDVLFIAAESSMNDLHTRRQDIFGHCESPAGLRFVPGELVSDYEGSLYQLTERWRQTVERPMLIVMDTLRALVDMRYRGRRNGGQTDEYAMLRPYWKYANEAVPILMIHHTSQRRLEEGEHWQNQIAGTNGLVGATDANMLLQATRDATFLRTWGRYVPETSYQLMRLGRTWQMFDAVAATQNLGDRMMYVLGLFADLGGTADVADVIARSSLAERTTRTYVTRLAQRGLLTRQSRGTYVMTEMLNIAANEDESQ